MKKEIVMERSFAAKTDKLWKALTEPAAMKQWYFDIPGFKAEVGHEFQFLGGSVTKKYMHHFKVIEVVPGKKLAYTWRYEGYPGDSLLTFELTDEGDSTKLKLTHTGLDSFPADLPDFALESFTAGWNMIINTNLKNYLEDANN